MIPQVLVQPLLQEADVPVGPGLLTYAVPDEGNDDFILSLGSPLSLEVSSKVSAPKGGCRDTALHGWFNSRTSRLDVGGGGLLLPRLFLGWLAVLGGSQLLV